MIVTINNAELMQDEPEFAAAIMQRVTQRYVGERTESITVHCSPRVPLNAEPYKNPGWIEYGIDIRYTDGGRMFVGAIQRKPGMDTEYHT